jgi:hypothetical protein
MERQSTQLYQKRKSFEYPKSLFLVDPDTDRITVNKKQGGSEIWKWKTTREEGSEDRKVIIENFKKRCWTETVEDDWNILWYEMIF